MSAGPPTVENPYATTPGSSTPGRGVSGKEGVADLWSFFWLSIAGTVILVGVGLAALVISHH
jgi:hypothetical protein